MCDIEKPFTKSSIYQIKNIQYVTIKQNYLENQEIVKYNLYKLTIHSKPSTTNLYKLIKDEIFFQYKFNTKNELKTAVILWCRDNKLAIQKYGDISSWDTSNITDMSYLFQNEKYFNNDISNWDVSNVTNMRYMFSCATSFNQPLDNWDVSNITNMNYMFIFATNFNQPLDNWDVSNIKTMQCMFYCATSFNQTLDNWDVSNVTDMGYMFYGASCFNQPLDNWDVSKVIDNK